MKISDRGCVITWDFDVMRHDVVFTVYRLKDPPPMTGPKSPLVVAATTTSETNTSEAASSEVKVVSSSNGGGGQTGQDGEGDHQSKEASSSAFPFPAKSGGGTTSGAGGASAAMSMESSTHVSVIEKQWREGVDYFKVESSIVCHDGESIQGSHVTSHVGTYVLQWRFYDKPPSSGHHHSALDDVIDSITQHKAKVMYYYETLSSSDYRGSMTSLQSCQSAFSNISKASR